jgi:hypothetical protein
MDSLDNKNTRKLFEIYHNMICENKVLESEIEYLESFIKAQEPVKQNAYSACETDSISGSKCKDYSAKVGGNVPEKQNPVSNFIQKMKKLEQLILNKYEEAKNCELNLIEILFSVLTGEIESLENLIETNEEAESVLLLIITMSINWEKECEDIDGICEKGDINKDDIQLILDNEMDHENEDYSIILAAIKIAFAIQLMKPVNDPMNDEYLQKRRHLVSNMSDYPVYRLVSIIVQLLDEEL